VETGGIAGCIALLAAHDGQDEILLVAQDDECLAAGCVGREAEEALEKGGKRRDIRWREVEMLQSHMVSPFR